MKRHLISLILTVVLVVGGVNVIPAGTKDVSAAMQLNDFESYYSRDLGQTENLLGTVSKEEKWNIDENGVITDTNSTWWNSGDELWKDMSVLKYNIYQYKDFTLTVDFKNHIRGDYEEDGATPKDNWEMRYGAFVGFGIKNNGGDITGWNGDNTGTIIKPYGKNSIKLAGSFDDINSKTHQSATQWNTTIDGVNIADEEWHTMKLEVKAGIIKITVDEQQAWPTQPLGYSDWYKGGYVVIGSNNGGTQFKNIKIAGDKVVLTSQEERLKEYSAYYASDLGTTGNILTSVNKTEKWYVDDDGVITDMNSTWWNSGDNLWPDMSMLAYNVQKYKEFSFSVDFKNNIRGDYEEDGVTKKDNWEVRYGAMIGFGTKVNADGSINGWNGEDTGVWIKPYGTNSIKLAGSFDDINSGTHQSATQYDTTIDGVDVSNDNWHNMKLEVKAGIIKITVDGKQAWANQPLAVSDSYDGGYLFLASNNGGTQFKNIQISEVKKPSVQIDGKKVEISDGKVPLGDAKYGYLCDGKMYAPNTTVEVVDGMTFTSVKELSVTMADGAGIRYKGNEEGTGGIRFQARIASDNMAAVASSAITEGTLITAKDINDAFKEELTLTYSHDKINVKNSGWFNGEIGTYCGSICRVNELNYIRDFTARAYVTVNYENADAVTIYSSMGPERNISDIAKEVKRQEYPGIAEEYWSVIDSFIKK